jgi:hypothetical protein
LNVGLVDFPYLRNALRALAGDQRVGANLPASGCPKPAENPKIYFVVGICAVKE